MPLRCAGLSAADPPRSGASRGRDEFCDAGSDVLCDALQDVDEIRVDIYPVQPTGHDERLDDDDVLALWRAIVSKVLSSTIHVTAGYPPELHSTLQDGRRLAALRGQVGPRALKRFKSATEDRVTVLQQQHPVHRRFQILSRQHKHPGLGCGV